MLTALELEFADGTYSFDLKLPQIIELQEKCGTVAADGTRTRKNILAIYSSVMAGRAFLTDGSHIGVPDQADAGALEIYETIRLALIGGGSATVNGEAVKVSALDAKRLVETYVHPMPLSAAWDIAAAIHYARVVGYQGKKKADPQSATAADQDVTDSPTLT